MDMSPGKPNTAAISDENMSVWMDYLYGQNATLINSPPQCNGVTVRLSAVDPNGNPVNIGTVTSDSTGQFKTLWTPTTTGTYSVYATFDGSNSYYGSYAETGTSSLSSINRTNKPTHNRVQPSYNNRHNDVHSSLSNRYNHCYCHRWRSDASEATINGKQNQNFFPFLVFLMFWKGLRGLKIC